jgi:hypothetical protein
VLLPARSEAPWNDKDIHGGAVAKAVVRIDTEVVPGQDGLAFPGDGVDVEEVLAFPLPCYSEHLERPREVHDFYVVEQQNGDPSCHFALPSAAVRSGGEL